MIEDSKREASRGRCSLLEWRLDFCTRSRSPQHGEEEHTLKKEEEDARLLDRCEAKRKEWSKQCDESVQYLGDKPWKNEEVQKIGGSAAKAKRVQIRKSFEMVQGENRSGMRWLPPKSSPGLDKRNER